MRPHLIALAIATATALALHLLLGWPALYVFAGAFIAVGANALIARKAN